MTHPLLEQVLPDDAELRENWLRKLIEPVPAVSASECDEQGWLSLAQLAAEPERLRHWLTLETQAQGAPDVRVSASQVFKRLCLDVLYPLIVEALVNDAHPRLAPELFYARWSDKEGLVLLAYTADGAGDQAVCNAPFVDSFNQLMVGLHGLFHNELRVSNGSYWSSGALALVRPWSQLLKRVSSANSKSLAEAATGYLDEFEPRLRRFMDWEPTLQEDGAQVWRPRRHGCCLKYRLPEGSLCGTCGRHRHLERRHRLADEQSATHEPSAGNER